MNKSGKRTRTALWGSSIFVVFTSDKVFFNCTHCFLFIRNPLVHNISLVLTFILQSFCIMRWGWIVLKPMKRILNFWQIYVFNIRWFVKKTWCNIWWVKVKIASSTHYGASSRNTSCMASIETSAMHAISNQFVEVWAVSGRCR